MYQKSLDLLPRSRYPSQHKELKMLAAWELRSRGDGDVEIHYNNFITGERMYVGVDCTGNGLTAFMSSEGGGGAEPVFLDGNLWGCVMPAVTDYFPSREIYTWEEVRA